jgi:nucleotide-binding universal stress UspA family protein
MDAPGLSHVFMGSIAERIVQKAPCAVLTVREADENKATAAA